MEISILTINPRVNDFNRKRTATVVCRQKTILGVLGYEDFQRILSNKGSLYFVLIVLDQLYERKYHDKIAFFLKVDLFQHWRSSELACLILHMEENKYTRNQVIYKEGDRSNRLYFITKGEIEVYFMRYKN